MIISGISKELDGDSQVWSANVLWEDSGRESKRIFVKLPASYQVESSQASNGFLLCCSLFAWQHSEERILVEGGLDPWLIANLLKAISYLNHWHNLNNQLSIESDELCRPNGTIMSNSENTRDGASALFFSGGLDSICSLVRNRLHLPLDHRLSIKQCVMVQGLDIDYDENKTGKQQEQLRNNSFQAVRNICGATDAIPVEVSTNLRTLDLDSNFYAGKAHGAILAGIAHFLSHSVSEIFVSSTNDISTLSSWGSHPLLDINYSSSGLRVHHDSEDLTRLEKLRIASSNSVAIDNLRVCSKAYNVPEKYTNCGKCRKCILAMLGYSVLGLDYSKCFPQTSSLIDLFKNDLGEISTEFQAKQIEELVVPLGELGRNDLAEECKVVLNQWQVYSDWKKGENINGLLKKILRRTLRH